MQVVTAWPCSEAVDLLPDMITDGPMMKPNNIIPVLTSRRGHMNMHWHLVLTGCCCVHAETILLSVETRVAKLQSGTQRCGQVDLQIKFCARAFLVYHNGVNWLSPLSSWTHSCSSALPFARNLSSRFLWSCDCCGQHSFPGTLRNAKRLFLLGDYICAASFAACAFLSFPVKNANIKCAHLCPNITFNDSSR